MKLSAKIKTLENLQDGIKVNDEKIVVNPVILFRRLSVLAKREEDPEKYFAYELTSEPY